jgi:hypothetical protein
MLTEVTKTNPVEGEPRRRWFTDRTVDLYVWYDDADAIVQFQICYDKGPEEKALNWNRDSGLSHRGVDDGESGVFRMKSTPILTGRADLDLEAVRRVFSAASGKLEYDLHEFIMRRLTGSKE